MTQTPTTLTVDFNRLDDDDVLWAPRDLAPDVSVGQPVALQDGEGNRCLGIVLRFDATRIYLEALLSTWQDGDPVDVTLEDDEALTDALHMQLRRTISGEVQLTVGVNTDE